MAKTTPPLKARAEFQERLKQGLVTRPVYQSCTHCHKDVSSDLEWACGYCGYENRRTTLYSIFYKCQKCDREPKSYVCPHCEKITALDVDGDSSHPAKHAPKREKPKKPEKQESAEEVRAHKRREHAEKKEELEQKVEIAQLEAKLTGVQKPSVADSVTAAREKVRQRIKAKLGEALDVRIVIKECRAQLAAEYKDDPDMLADFNDALKWIEENEMR